MNEWPQTIYFDHINQQVHVVRRGVDGSFLTKIWNMEKIPVIPADLGRELEDALLDIKSNLDAWLDGEGSKADELRALNAARDRAIEALARYEAEVGE